MIYGGSRLGMETTSEIVNAAVDYVNDCNNDGLATAVIEFGSAALGGSTSVEIILGATEIADETWASGPISAAEVQDLADDINEQAIDYYAIVITLASDHHYLQLNEIVAGSLNGIELICEHNNVDVTNTEILRQPTTGECAADRNLGKKFYELTNYLGNVNEVISDRKIAHNNSGDIDYFEADVISYADYYPFGMEMPGRKGDAGLYRYGYNGMEKDREVSGDGNSYTTQFRQYDPRLGRWKSLDPLASMFIDVSPYTAFANNPIFFVDPLGLKPDPGRKENGKEQRKHNKMSRAMNRAEKWKQEHGIDNYELSESGSGNIWMTWETKDGTAKAHMILGSIGKGRRWAEKQTKERRKAQFVRFGTLDDGIDPRLKDADLVIGGTDGNVRREFLEQDIPLQIEPYTGNIIDMFDRIEGGRQEFEYNGCGYHYDDDGNLCGGGMLPKGGAGGLEWISGGPLKALGAVARIKHATYLKIPIRYRSTFVTAMQKGVVATEGSRGISGILVVKDKAMLAMGYTHKIKIIGEGGKYRVYGKQDANGNLIFDYLVKNH